MTYREWFDAHAKRHKALVDKLLAKGMDKAEIIDYFDFDNMVEAEPDFCPLYAEQKKCHPIEKLNCYLCACPNFRFNDGGLPKEFTSPSSSILHSPSSIVYSTCSIDSKEGKPGVFGNAIHQDCSGCGVPHRHDYIDKRFDTEWTRMMAGCKVPGATEE